MVEFDSGFAIDLIGIRALELVEEIEAVAVAGGFKRDSQSDARVLRRGEKRILVFENMTGFRIQIDDLTKLPRSLCDIRQIGIADLRFELETLSVSKIVALRASKLETTEFAKWEVFGANAEELLNLIANQAIEMGFERGAFFSFPATSRLTARETGEMFFGPRLLKLNGSDHGQFVLLELSVTYCG